MPVGRLTGMLKAAVGIGGLVGTAVVGVLVLRRKLGPPILIGATILGIGVVILGLSGSMIVSMLAIAAASGGALLTEVVLPSRRMTRTWAERLRGRLNPGSARPPTSEPARPTGSRLGARTPIRRGCRHRHFWPARAPHQRSVLPPAMPGAFGPAWSGAPGHA